MKKSVFFELLFLTSLIITAGCGNQTSYRGNNVDGEIITGADQTAEYVPYLKGKNVAMAINNSSTIGNELSLDSLLSLGINIKKVFTPEHGLRGDNVYDSIDSRTGLPTVSLFGAKNKPTKEDLEGIDVVIFDKQDVGTRFYTYLATLHYVMEACAENNVEVIVLDRPNPNDSYVDGPVLEEQFKSFVGLNPVPIVHGMTFGEYAQMLNGEGWLANGVQCKLKVITILNYEHGKPYILPIKPSPNLNTQQSILLYPSLCWFEGTVISEGRGTCMPFQILGHPALKGKYTFSFTPVSIPTMSTNPKHLGETCYGLDLRNYDTDKFRKTGKLNLDWLLELYSAYPDKENFFRQGRDGSYSFDRLVGTDQLRLQIIKGLTEREIRNSWEPKLSEFKKIREKYLIYK
ncbi:MAG TPA: DUF1343 domain-containing protein [Bacteroidales bacterium]|jgi:uncharacterized protein YbbC (DUF1343 family)|nr:DUF1343 domain-containing protein [Bacteroidales bacterium]HQJ82167.1 DUF1343 domain-containing protein [Bacteroidales bacterium]